jgi:hypothetical protein
MKTDCPKCGSPNARYEKSSTDLTVVCFCGYRKVVFSLLDSQMEVQHNEPAVTARLPKPGTHLHHTLTCLWAIAPASSKEVTDTLILQGLQYTVSDISSYLMMLRARGLVSVLEYRRGMPGGSTWELTAVADTLLGG